MPTPQPGASDAMPPDLMPIAIFAANHFFEKSDWPLVREVLRQNFDEVAEVEQRIQRLSGIVYGMTVGSVPSLDAKVVVDIAVMAQLDINGAKQFTQDYVKFIQICAFRFSQPNADPKLTSSALLDMLLLGAKNDMYQVWLSDFIRLLYIFLQSNVERPGLYKLLSGGNGAEWSMEIGDLIRYFLKVHTLEEYLAERQKLLKQNQPPTAEVNLQPLSPQPRRSVQTVFLVHGHDHAMRDKVELTLRRMGLAVVILSESAYAGRFTLQKFEEEAAKADFAVVLVTEDDVAVAKREIAAEGDISRSQLQARGRQNVIWEWGYLFHKLGTRHVCVLKTPGVEMFSDLLGRGYVELTTGWEDLLRREIAAANQNDGA